MERTNVSSSNIKSIGFDPTTSTLEVEFNSGSVYQYFGVGVLIYGALMAAPSKGGFLASQIKNSYRYERV